jgi:hypothetical protein
MARLDCPPTITNPQVVATLDQAVGSTLTDAVTRLPGGGSVAESSSTENACEPDLSGLFMPGNTARASPSAGRPGGS